MENTNQFRCRVWDMKFEFISDPKLFSPNQLDSGSRLLLESLPPLTNEKIIDIGCGLGTMGIILAKKYPNCQILMVDNDPLAIEISKENIKLNKLTNIRALKLDVTNQSIEERFNLAISNLPWTKNKSVTPSLIKFAFAHLEISGNLFVVINQTFKTEDYLENYFGNCENITAKNSYKILKATKPDYVPNDLQSYFQKQNFETNFLLGQYFLADTNIINKIVDLGKVTKNETVLEIGCGMGSLTLPLSSKCQKLVGVEIDPRFNKYLPNKPNIEYFFEDGIKLLNNPDFKKFGKVFANLPYTSADAFIRKFSKVKAKLFVLMIPKTLALKRGYKIEYTVSRSHFYPMPKTDSVVVCLTNSQMNTSLPQSSKTTA